MIAIRPMEVLDVVTWKGNLHFIMPKQMVQYMHLRPVTEKELPTVMAGGGGVATIKKLNIVSIHNTCY